MRKKGKKKLAGRPSHLSPQPCDDSNFERTLINLENYAKTVGVTSYEVVMADGDCGGSDILATLFPVHRADQKYSMPKIRVVMEEGKNPNIRRNNMESQYYDRVRGYMEMWKVQSFDLRKEGRKSLIKVLRSDGSGGGDEELRDGVFDMLLGVGVKISSLMAEYFSLFHGTLDVSEMLTRFQVVRNTLLFESLRNVHASPVIDKFVKVVDSAIKKIGISGDKNLIKYQFLFGNRESELLGSIFLKVLYLEFAFCCPTVPKKLETKDLMSIKDFLEKLFEQKLGELSSEMNEFKKRCQTSDFRLSSKRSELKEALDSEIKEIWKGCTLDKLCRKN